MAASNWYKWKNRKTIPNIKEPGVYHIALSGVDISCQPFSMKKEIIYIGVSISDKGVDGRLDQFERAMYGANGIHGGAERVRFKHKNPTAFFENAYVAVLSFPLPTKAKNTPADLRQKGNCLAAEQYAIADYLDIFGRLPEFNDQKKSPKK
jgi:hypothetical protein